MTQKIRLFNSKELADYIGSTEGTIRTWQCVGKIPPQWYVKIGSLVRYDKVEVDKTIEMCKKRKLSLKDLLHDSTLKEMAYGC